MQSRMFQGLFKLVGNGEVTAASFKEVTSSVICKVANGALCKTVLFSLAGYNLDYFNQVKYESCLTSLSLIISVL